jgi:hypothetical protein
MAVLSIGLLAIIGFIIDIGTLERTQIQLQKAADAGVLGGLDYRIQAGLPNSPSDESEIVERTRKFVRQNLALKGFDTSSPKLIISNPVYTKTDSTANNNETLSVTISYDTPYLLMPFVPLHMLGIADTSSSRSLAVVSKAVVPRANIVLVLDTSNSMACPSTDPNCSCADPNLTSTACNLSPNPGVAKIYDLRRAVYDFLGKFREGHDRIALVSFDLVAKTLVHFDRDGDGSPDGFQVSDFEAQLGQNGQLLPADFSPGGLTNPSDGFLTALEEMSNAGLFVGGKTSEPVSLVFFTDGAPTAKIGCYSNAKGSALPAPAGSNGVACPGPGRRYVDLELEWVYSDGARVRGPSPLFDKVNLLSISKVDRIPNRFLLHSNGTVDASMFPGCSGLARPDSSRSTANAYVTAFQNCLTDFASYLPDSNIQQDGESLSNYKQSFFHRAIAVADYLRKHGVIFYTIGFGPLSSADPKTDVYEGINDDFHRKDGFLILLADDTDRAQNELHPASGAYPAFSYNGFDTWENRIHDTQDGRTWNGMSVSGESGDGISALFLKVAHQIQLRFLK